MSVRHTPRQTLLNQQMLIYTEIQVPTTCQSHFNYKHFHASGNPICQTYIALTVALYMSVISTYLDSDCLSYCNLGLDSKKNSKVTSLLLSPLFCWTLLHDHSNIQYINNLLNRPCLTSVSETVFHTICNTNNTYLCALH